MTTRAVADPGPLAAWIRSVDGFIGALEVRCPPGGVRGLYAGADIAAGDVLLDLPRRALMLPEDAAAHVPVDVVRAVASGMADHVLLALRLVGTAADPAWRPFHDALPTALLGHPLSWSPEDLAWLDGTSLRRLVEDRRELLREELRGLRAAGVVASGATAAGDAAWAHVRTLVSSRVFDLDGAVALVPFADLMNHAPISQVVWGLQEDRFVLRARVDVGRGHEVCDDYGKKANGRLLLHYGFTMPDNPEAECVVYPWVYGPFRVRARADEDSAALFAAVREAPGLLEETCREALARLRTPAPDDAALPENHRNAARVHADERRVLEWLSGV